MVVVPAREASADPQLALHLVRKTTGQPSCHPNLPSCTAALTEGLLEAQGGSYYFVYLVAAWYDTTSDVQEVHVGLHFDPTTLSGVDIFSWNLCADGQTPSAGWFQEGGDNRITWAAPGSDSLAVAGYFYVTAYTPGRLALVEPAGTTASLTPFGGSAQAIPKSSLGYVGFGALEGCNPCLHPCDYTPVRPSTWSSIKSVFGSR